MSSRNFNWFWVIALSLTMPLGVIVSTNLARRSFEKIKLRDQIITVKGYAERKITADSAVWSVSVIARKNEMIPANNQLSEGRKVMLEFLTQHGFAVDQVELGPVDIKILHPRDEHNNVLNAIEGYVLTQSFTVQSGDVNKIAKTAREVSSLIDQGIELNSSPPSYFYSKLDDLKLQMLTEAAANGHERARSLIPQGNAHLGQLRSASQGVFQITPIFSTDVSDSGVNDTSTIDKIIKAVVTVEYAIE